jgi:hypothetical protein
VKKILSNRLDTCAGVTIGDRVYTEVNPKFKKCRGPAMHTFRFITPVAGFLLLFSASSSAAETQNTHPCELLSETMVREVYDVPADTPVEQQDRSDSRFPNCTYRWRVMSEAQEQEAKDRNHEKMVANIQAHKPPTEGINYNIPTHAKVTLTAVGFDTSEQAQSALESARSYMIGRAEQAGREPTPWMPVDGVGSKAYYHGTQISFTWRRLLIHLDASPEERAVKLATAVMD